MFLKRLHFILPEKQQLANNWVEGGGVGQKLGKGNCPSQVDTLYVTTLVSVATHYNGSQGAKPTVGFRGKAHGQAAKSPKEDREYKTNNTKLH